MKKLLTLLMVLGLASGSIATADASQAKSATRTERTVEGTYGPFPAPVTGCTDPLGSWACMIVPTRSNERFFTAKVMDLHGQPIFVEAFADGQEVGTFCGETSDPIAIRPGASLTFYLAIPLWPADMHLDCPANRVKTTGTISVTLSNLPPLEPVRSGSILTGTGWGGVLGGCQMSPECSAWLYSDCQYGLEGTEPGLTASIVNVDDLTDGQTTERVFRFGSGEPWAPVWGGVQLQFFGSDCVEIPQTRMKRSVVCAGEASADQCWSLRFRIPSDAEWMTVTGYQDNVNLTWALY